MNPHLLRSLVCRSTAVNEATQALTTMEQADTYWVRWPLGWAAIEPTDREPASYQWGSSDTSILNATNSELQLIVTIGSNPNWASPYRNGPIDGDDVAEFAEFMGAVVERYDGDGLEDAPGHPVVRYWEFYNEPDGASLSAADAGIGYWGLYGAEYAQMLCTVYPVMKAADPSAQIVFGGIAYDNFLDGQGNGTFVREFLDNVLTAGGGACFDIMNFHYYPVFDWSTYGAGLIGKTNYLRQKLQTYGLSKPMMITEAGWTSADYLAGQGTPEIQCRYVVKFFTQAMAADLEALTWWTWIDPANESYGKFGLLDSLLETKTSYSAYKVAEEKLGLATFADILSLETGVEGYHFISRYAKPLYVLWATDGATHTVSLPVSTASVVSMYGNTLFTVSDSADGTSDGGIQVTFGANPVYVEVQP